MVHKNNKWNISKEKGEEYAHRYIIEILKDSKNNTLGLSELIILLNQRTKHINIKIHQKKKPISVYIKHIYGSFINFLDIYSFYGIMDNQGDIKVILFDSELNENTLDPKIINEHKEWILINDDFIFV
tara:strand:- start:289 stop:672 length:384 start_codon:yes stop_codon:yes gene_type:complete